MHLNKTKMWNKKLKRERSHQYHEDIMLLMILYLVQWDCEGQSVCDQIRPVDSCTALHHSHQCHAIPNCNCQSLQPINERVPMVLIIIKKIDIYLSILSDQQSPYRENSVSLSPEDHKFIPKIINLKMETFFKISFTKYCLKSKT